MAKDYYFTLLIFGSCSLRVFSFLNSEIRKFCELFVLPFMLGMTGYMLKGTTGVNLAWSKSNLSVIQRLACASCINHDTHSLICSAQAP